jgi:lysophospholipase L1-like esterase
LGIVDCAPRLFYWLEQKFVGKMPNPFRQHYIKFIKNVRKRTVKRVQVKPAAFYKNIEEYVNRAKAVGVKSVYIIKIMKASSKYVRLNPAVKESVEYYNKILDNLEENHELVTLVSLLSDYYDTDEISLGDGYHLNAEGHDLVFNHIKDNFVNADFN